TYRVVTDGVSDGVCDATVLLFFEKQRGADKRSEEWIARQKRKIDGGLKALAEWLGDDENKEFLLQSYQIPMT
ncbi:MAG: hypothetical protein HETSPECPRED_005492, partial [Heterodermia speciosa]